MPLVTLAGASVRYRDRWALRDIDLTLTAGGHLAILGANGSGKSTLLRLIAGEVWPAPDLPATRRPDLGDQPRQREYRLGHGAEHDALTARTRIRLVGPEAQDRFLAERPRDPGRLIVSTGFDGSFILRRPLTTAENRQIQKCLLRVGARAFADRPIGELSRGELRRLLIARALVAEPAVLCLDEICDGLDDTARERLLGLLDRLAADGLTVVMATHHPDDLPRCIRRHVVLEAGRIVSAEVVSPPPGRAASQIATQGRGQPSRAGHTVLRPLPRTPGTPLIAIERADVYRGDRRVFADLNWQLLPGRHWRITGPNGTGKSTFIKLLYGDIRPARGGCISWFGSGRQTNVWAVRRRIGLVSDELQAAYLDRLSVRDCIATGYAASIGRVPRVDAEQEARIEHWIDVVGLGNHRATSIRELSYGQLRRTLLARALVIGPDVLLLDEAGSGLDRASREALSATLHAAAARGAHIVMAGHRFRISDALFTDELHLAETNSRCPATPAG